MKKYLPVFITIVFTSCNPNNDDSIINPKNTEPFETKYLPSKLITSEETTYFHYDNQDRLIRFEQKSNENLYSKEFSIFYKDDLVNKIVLNYESSDLYSYTNLYTFEHIDNKVIIANKFTDINDYSVTQSRTIRIDITNFLTSGFGIKTIYDDQKNLVEISDENIDTKNKFDDKNAIYKNVNTPQWLLYYVLKLGIHQSNNPLEIHTTKIELDETNSSEISYEYNSDNYPIKQLTIDDNNYTIETEIEYLVE